MPKPSHQIISHLEFRIPISAVDAGTVSLRDLSAPSGGYEVDLASKPVTATKVLANGDRVTLTRIVHDDRSHEIIAAYDGSLSDPGHVRFALDNMLLDLIAVGIIPAADFPLAA
jgi:hypothetical protein